MSIANPDPKIRRIVKRKSVVTSVVPATRPTMPKLELKKYSESTVDVLENLCTFLSGLVNGYI